MRENSPEVTNVSPPEGVEDVIIDVIVGGRVLLPRDIPPAVTAAIEAALAKREDPGEIHHDGVCYWWAVRPCVYP